MEEIPVNDEIGKKQKLDGKVMALGKIMTQHLGLALATACRSRAGSNECCMLELSGAWEPMYSESSLEAYFGGRSHFGFSYGNQICSV